MGVNDVVIVLTEQSLRGRTDAEAVLQLLVAAHGDPGALGSEALHMVLLLLEQGLGDQNREIHVLMTGFLELLVQVCLDVLPDGVAIGTIDEHTLYRGIVDQFCLFADVSVPLSEIHVTGGNGVYLSLILCHNLHSFTSIL